MSKSYMDQCLAGDVLLEEIDGFVAKWHEDKNTQLSLREYLGFSLEEYKLWAEKPAALDLIIFARKNNLPLKKAIGAQAAAAKVITWLKKKGRVKTSCATQPGLHVQRCKSKSAAVQKS